jgi:uncharacterized membrane protein
MAFCGNCGTQTQDGVKFCPSCGHTIGAANAQQAAQGARTQAGGQAPRYTPPVVPGAPTQADIRDANDNKTMSILAYILFFIPLLTGAHKTSAFAKYHTNQGTVLFIAALALNIILGIVRAILRSILWNGFYYSGSWGVYSTLGTVLGIIGLVPFILCVVGIINAVNGRMKPLPVIGGITIIK